MREGLSKSLPKPDISLSLASVHVKMTDTNQIMFFATTVRTCVVLIFDESWAIIVSLTTLSDKTDTN